MQSLQELRDDVAAPRAERLADADLAGPFGDRDEHDVHDDEGADDEADGRERGAEEDEFPFEFVEEAERGVGAGEGEVILVAGAEAVEGAERPADHLLPVEDCLACRGLDDDLAEVAQVDHLVEQDDLHGVLLRCGAGRCTGPGPGSARA